MGPTICTCSWVRSIIWILQSYYRYIIVHGLGPMHESSRTRFILWILRLASISPTIKRGYWRSKKKIRVTRGDLEWGTQFLECNFIGMCVGSHFGSPWEISTFNPWSLVPHISLIFSIRISKHILSENPKYHLSWGSCICLVFYQKSDLFIIISDESKQKL